ncbi:hypothetical protein MLD38_025044 [Melastoma candidum]|uniref:Uncharacterized protein n=1 Tax=Melastoma candidum TaxID=119954 RepID=A0ACB9NVU5_9MYRT|nr:hypothetical protein MLD38_025044 [Melastoma candidum]
MRNETVLLLILLLSVLLWSGSSSDTFDATQSFRDADVLVSVGGTFVLGFFSPSDSGQRFLGIWYARVSVPTVVWVANRENPLNDSSGALSVDSLGNLIISSNNSASLVWSTNNSLLPAEVNSSPVVQLLDSGNLVLYQDVDKKVILWQSFDHPTDTMLPNMKIGYKKTSSRTWSITSWRSYDDPRPGICTFMANPTGYPQLFLYKDGAPHWRTGPWTGSRWSGIPEMRNNYVFNIFFVNDGDEFSITYIMINTSILSTIVVNETGTIDRMNWIEQEHRWVPMYSAPGEPCDYYNQCGPNGLCDPYKADLYTCSCFPGFQPRYPNHWLLKDTTGGCVRNTGASICQSGEGFVGINNTKLPDTSIAQVNMTMTLRECESACLRNCSCTAYASATESGGGSGCLMWYGELNDTRTFNNGQQIYIREDAAELDEQPEWEQESHTGDNAAGIGRCSFASISLCLTNYKAQKRYICWPELFPMKGSDFDDSLIRRHFCTCKTVNSSIATGGRRLPALWPRTPKNPSSVAKPLDTKELDRTGKSDAGLPSFKLSSVAAFTDNFSLSNRLGVGGFGTVYKGVMSDGTEVAVKRLSEFSRQGDEEFKNEVNLIARLQHRNLVRMLGFCLKDNEKILVYEYLPNKSLDAFLFDKSKKSLLDWRIRFDILTGVARGLMYLHQDSRLRVIHRDLKASNVLLDTEMQPKISDFGMARMCGGDQSEGTTNRVVGTFGYMSPEYAMEGVFSVKSDVYSFGILLLEIISGKKISSYYDEGSSTNLVGHFWELWKGGLCMEIIDESIAVDEPHTWKEVLKCIQIGLLCVQELPTDRPTMSTVIFMLGNDTGLASPRQPAYTIRKKNNMGTTNNSSSDSAASVNQATISIIEGR